MIEEEVCPQCEGYGSVFIFCGPEYDLGFFEPCINCEEKGYLLGVKENDCDTVQQSIIDQRD
mgnify:CR=1 FL=1